MGKYKTSDLIDYIQDLVYTEEDILKVKEIEDRLLELDNLKIKVIGSNHDRQKSNS